MVVLFSFLLSHAASVTLFMPTGPINALGYHSHLHRCLSRLWSQGTSPSFPGSRLRFVIAMKVHHSYLSSING